MDATKTSALDRDKWSTSCLDHFTPMVTATGTAQEVVWRASLDFLLLLRMEPQIVQPIAQSVF